MVLKVPSAYQIKFRYVSYKTVQTLKFQMPHQFYNTELTIRFKNLQHVFLLAGIFLAMAFLDLLVSECLSNRRGPSTNTQGEKSHSGHAVIWLFNAMQNKSFSV